MFSKKVFICCCVLLFVVCLAGCAEHLAKEGQEQEGWHKLLTALGQSKEPDEIVLFEDLQLALFDYYNSIDEPYYHCQELRLLPHFGGPASLDNQLSWDEVSHWLSYFAQYNQETYSWAAADFQAAAEALLPDYTVPRKDSAYVIYNQIDDCFVASGWDDNGGEYYELFALEFNSNQMVFTAQFRAYEVDEMWYDELYASTSANDTALRDYALKCGYMEDNISELDVAEAMKTLLFDKTGEFDEELLAGKQLLVKFRLSGNERLPFTYLYAEADRLI